ncbi:MAG: low molecular weight phosphotyrosine protein phosphatase [Bacteroidia bacterium]|nr:low molecular weight phosphotyrosine protein phosphatase [Bacteroidia bacterium]
MTNVLMVCLGNICRSPMAEGILRSKANELGIKVKVDSAGTANFHVGECPDSRAIKTAKQFGVDISPLRGRQFNETDFDKFDHIFVMDGSNKENVLKLARNENDKKKVKLLLELSSEFESKDVPDPWFGGDEGFVEVYEMLDKACGNFLTQEVKN